FTRLPFGSLMPHLAAGIHHGGIGTLAQAFAAGIPQVLLAWGLDRPDNAQHAEQLGVARFLPESRWTAAAITDALDHLLDDPLVHAGCQDLARRLREHDSLSEIVQFVESLPLIVEEETARTPDSSPTGSVAAARPAASTMSEQEDRRAKLAQLS